jgi:MoaA/NifB/PqqE/SkfB family radical SAM enzyme
MDLRTHCSRYNPDSDTLSVSHAEGCTRDHPLSVCFEPTNRCPVGCPYCLIENHEREDLSRLHDVLGRCITAGVGRIGFGGGEPLLLGQELYDLGQAARRRGVGTLLRTSGTLPIVAADARDAFDWVDISIDSLNKEVMRRARPRLDLETALMNVRHLCDAGMRVRISILPTQLNLSTITETVAGLHELGVHHLRLGQLVPRGRARRTWNALAVERSSVDDVVQEAARMARQLGMSLGELNSVASGSIVIVKPSGDIYVGEASGAQAAGSVFDHAPFTRIGDGVREMHVGLYGS